MIESDGPGLLSAEALEGFRAYLLAVANVRLRPDLGVKAGASDLVQETLLAAVRDGEAFRGESPEDLKRWLKGILLHLMANLRRQYLDSAKRGVGREQPLTDQDPADSASSVSAAAMRGELRVSLAGRLAALPAHYRRALLYRHRDELSFEQIGDRMGLSAEAARKVWGRAVVRLRESMGTADGPG